MSTAPGTVDAILKVLSSQSKGGTGLDTSSHPYVVRCQGDPDPVNPDARINQHVIGWMSAPPGETLIAFPTRDANGVATSNEPKDENFALAPYMTFNPANPVCPTCGKALAL